MRIGLLGGTFDPIHLGHLLVAEQVREQLSLDEVWFLPANVPPHKIDQTIIPAHHRLAMVECSVKDHPHFRVSAIELERHGRSYTVDTLIELKKRYADYRFFFIIGADMVKDLPNWYRLDELKQLTTFVGINRLGYDINEHSNDSSAYVRYVTIPYIGLSATDIRKRVRSGRSIRYMVPECVRCYIEEHRLYEP